MPQSTLLVAGAVDAAAAAAYGVVAWRLARRRPLDAGDALAMRCFALWWSALAANLALVAPVYFLAAFGGLGLPIQLASSVVQRVLLALSLVGLMAYLLYLLTGRARIAVLAAVYTAYVGLLLASLVYQQPRGVEALAWRTDLAYARQAPLWSELASFFLIVLPPVASSVAYLRLLPRMSDRTQRYRTAMVSAALLVWWTVAVVAGQPTLLDVGALQIVARLLSVVAAMAVLSAFTPPAWVRRRFGVEAYPGLA